MITFLVTVAKGYRTNFFGNQNPFFEMTYNIWLSVNLSLYCLTVSGGSF